MERADLEATLAGFAKHVSEPVRKALYLADAAHRGQVRKYTNEPYILHPMEVASILIRHGIADDTTLCAALLHDTTEDTDLTYDAIGRELGTEVIKLVYWLSTDNVPKSQGSRRVRKMLAAEHISRSPLRAKAVKLADILHNTADIHRNDPEFARTYLSEKLDMVHAIGPTLDGFKDEHHVRIRQLAMFTLNEIERMIWALPN